MIAIKNFLKFLFGANEASISILSVMFPFILLLFAYSIYKSHWVVSPIFATIICTWVGAIASNNYMYGRFNGTYNTYGNYSGYGMNNIYGNTGMNYQNGIGTNITNINNPTI